MKKLSLVIAVAMFGHAAFAGNPKTTNNEVTITSKETPNDDPNAPPPPLTTYYLVKDNQVTIDAADAVYVNNSTIRTYDNSVLSGANVGRTVGYIPFSTSACRTAWLNSKINSSCVGTNCVLFSKYYGAANTCTTSLTIFPAACP